MSAETQLSIPITLKWSKQVFSFTIQNGDTGRSFKEQVYQLTKVPIERQKLLLSSKSKKGSSIAWKKSLADDFVFVLVVDDNTAGSPSPLIVMLSGSAEAVAQAPTERTRFVEDMTEDERNEEEKAKDQAAWKTATGMIPALQFQPRLRDDGKQEVYKYNWHVTGLPQRSIEDLLKQQQGNSKTILENTETIITTANTTTLLGKVAMTLGMELRRAYVNDATVLNDGTLVTGLDDGHVQLWKHAELQHDVIPRGVATNEGGVDSVLAIVDRRGGSSYSYHHTKAPSFCTSARGAIQLWTKDGNEIGSFLSPMPGTSPVSLVQVPIFLPERSSSNHNHNHKKIVCLAASFRITARSNPHQFRLVPQDAEGQRRRALAEEQEAARQERLDQMSKSIQILYQSSGTTTTSTTNTTNQDDLPPPLQSHLLTVHNDPSAAPITCLASIISTLSDDGDDGTSGGSSFLVAGDAAGGLRMWKPRVREEDVFWTTRVDFVQEALFQLLPSDDQSSCCSIVCMEPLDGRRLAVSTTATTRVAGTMAGARLLNVPLTRAVYILQLQNNDDIIDMEVVRVLSGHPLDAVHCLCALPNGDLMTGGAKLDATLQLWKSSQLNRVSESLSSVQGEEGEEVQEEPSSFLQTKSFQSFTEAGYVFGLTVLHDHKAGSSGFAVAAARYNTIKIIL